MPRFKSLSIGKNLLFRWKTLDSIPIHRTPSDTEENIFEAYLSFRWKHSILFVMIAIHRTLTDTILGPTIKPKHDFVTSSENRSLRWNPLDSIRVHRNPQGTDGRIHVINFLTSGVFNHYHFR